MKTAKFFSAVIVMAFMAVIPANAQSIAFGLKGGVNFTKMSIDEDGVESKAGTGFFVGPTLKIGILPFLGVQGSLMYEQTNSKVDDETIKRQSIIVPLDVRLNFSAASLVGIYVATGPQFGFNVGSSEFEWYKTSTYKETFDINKSNFNWNIGAGVMLGKKLEAGILYSIGISKTGELEEVVNKAKDNNTLKPKSNSWKISATYFF